MPVASGYTSLPVGPTSGGKILAYNNLTTTPAPINGPNANRVSVTFHNPGAVDVFIAPLFVLVPSGPVTSSNTPLVPSLTQLGGCIRVFANGGTWTISGECQGGWQAFSASGSGNPLTVIETNV